jgi:septal ring factor EnvC (AmiA/AmiB activator)
MSTETNHKIKEAFERLMLGRPEITDGTLTISNICLEARVSRASYYRSPHAAQIKQTLDTPQTKRPEIEQLREELRQLKRTERQLRSENASETRELRDTLKTYANQIQALTLHATQLQTDNLRLRDNLEHAGDNITPLKPRR